jgi:purine-binding chemotaxis protein CheW
MSKELHIVGFRVGREHYGVPIISLQEIVRVPEITAVPDAPAHIEGVINLRGKIVSIIDLRKRFGEKNITSDRQNRILVTEFQHRLAGLIVDAASEVVKIPAADVDPPPAIFEEGSGLQCVTGVGKHRGRLIMLLDLGKLLQHDLRPERLAMAATAAANPAPAPNPSKGR